MIKMIFYMICIKFDQTIKNLNFGLLRFFKNLGFKKKNFEAIFQLWLVTS